MKSDKTKTTTITETPPKQNTKKTIRSKKPSMKAGTLSEQIEAFLGAGGEIQEIPSGVSGQPSLACRRSMTISEKAPKKPQTETAKP